MEGHYHAAVWIDHHQARVLHFNAAEYKSQVIHPAHRHEDKRTDKRPKEDQAFLEAVTKALVGAGAILVSGPANEKTELVKHIEKAHPAVRSRIEAIESADHPSEGEFVAHARRVLKSAERMLPQV